MASLNKSGWVVFKAQTARMSLCQKLARCVVKFGSSKTVMSLVFFPIKIIKTGLKRKIFRRKMFFIRILKVISEFYRSGHPIHTFLPIFCRILRIFPFDHLNIVSLGTYSLANEAEYNYSISVET